MIRFISCYWIVSFFALLVTPASICGQSRKWPYKAWSASLHVKKDVQEREFRKVYSELLRIDSSEICEVMQRLSETGSEKNDLFQLRLGLLRSYLGFRTKKCPGWLSYKEEMELALQRSHKINDELSTAFLSQRYSEGINYVHDIASATLHAVNAADIQDKLGPELFHNVARARYLLGHLMYHTREYGASIAYTMQALQWRLDTVPVPGDTTNAFYMMNAWNTIALAHEKSGRYDEANTALDSAAKWSLLFDRPFWRGLIAGNRGDILLMQGKYDEAEKLLAIDYAASKEEGELDNAANSLQWLAYINIIHRKLDTAALQLREARNFLSKMPSRPYLVNYYSTKAELFKAQRQLDSVIYYTQLANVLEDSLTREVAISKSDIARLKATNQSNIFEIRNLEKNRQRAATLRNFTIMMLLMLGTIGWLYLNRLQLKFKLSQEQARQKIQQALAEAQQAKNQLSEFMQRLIEKTTVIEKLKKELLEKENIREQQQIIHTLSNQTILTEEDWNRFKTLFDAVYTGFFHRLREYTPDVSLAEQRMAALIRLQLPTKEAASLLAVSPDTIHKTRQRLKHRLLLPADADLDEFILQL